MAVQRVNHPELIDLRCGSGRASSIRAAEAMVRTAAAFIASRLRISDSCSALASAPAMISLIPAPSKVPHSGARRPAKFPSGTMKSFNRFKRTD